MSEDSKPLLIPNPLLGGLTVAECAEILGALNHRIEDANRNVAEADAAADHDGWLLAQASLQASRSAALHMQTMLQHYEDAFPLSVNPRMTPVAGQKGFVTPEQIAEFRERTALAVAAADGTLEEPTEPDPSLEAGGSSLADMEPRGRA